LGRINVGELVLCKPECRCHEEVAMARLKGNSLPPAEVALVVRHESPLRIRKGAKLYEGVHAITDAESFGRAFADVRVQMHNRRLQMPTSIGALMEVLNEPISPLRSCEGRAAG
jgi:hypothetical protein